MATYTVRAFDETGFNFENIPDSPSLLNKASYRDYTGYELFQNGELPTIKIKCTYAKARKIDYIRIMQPDDENRGEHWWYYFVIGRQMLATDVCQLTLKIDFITSMGGIENIHFLDGVTERVHVDDDSYGAYTEEDPLLAPLMNLKLDTEYYTPSNSCVTVIESTVNPFTTLTAKPAAVYTPTSGDDQSEILVPQLKYSGATCNYLMGGQTAQSKTGLSVYVVQEASEDSGFTQEALANLRSLGVESAIISQTAIPTDYVNLTQTSYSTSDGEETYSFKAVTAADGIDTTQVIELPYAPYSCNNQRIQYAECNNYGIMSTSGESITFEPAEIYDYKNSYAKPRLRIIADPHTDGKPYFRFQTVDKDTTNIGFWRNCISGMKWKQIPLIFTSVSGSALNTLQYQNSRRIAEVAYNSYMRNSNYGIMSTAVSGGISALTSLASPITIMESGSTSKTSQSKITSGLLSSVSTLTDTALSIGGSLIDQYNTGQAYNANLVQDQTNYAIQQNIAVPTVNFPYNSDAIRDFYGNGCIIFRYLYSSEDVKRIDKLLTMYGYRVTKALTQSDFTNRKYFNYVKCADLTVTNDTNNSTWVNESIATQLRNGVRVWHTTPKVSYYNNENPIV